MPKAHKVSGKNIIYIIINPKPSTTVSVKLIYNSLCQVVIKLNY